MPCGMLLGDGQAMEGVKELCRISERLIYLFGVGRRPCR